MARCVERVLGRTSRSFAGVCEAAKKAGVAESVKEAERAVKRVISWPKKS
jgi:hypothetical protein